MNDLTSKIYRKQLEEKYQKYIEDYADAYVGNVPNNPYLLKEIINVQNKIREFDIMEAVKEKQPHNDIPNKLK